MARLRHHIAPADNGNPRGGPTGVLALVVHLREPVDLAAGLDPKTRLIRLPAPQEVVHPLIDVFAEEVPILVEQVGVGDFAITVRVVDFADQARVVDYVPQGLDVGPVVMALRQILLEVPETVPETLQVVLGTIGNEVHMQVVSRGIACVAGCPQCDVLPLT